MCKIITITSPTASGKDSILKRVIEKSKEENLNVEFVLSTTSRPMREGENQGIEYNFISYEECLNKLYKDKTFIESRIYNTECGLWIYGIENTSIDILSDKVYIAIIDFNGLLQLERYCELNNIELKSFYIDCKNSTRLERSLKREPDASDKQILEMCRRIISDNDIVLPAKYYVDEVLVNEQHCDINHCVNTILEECRK